MRVVLALAESDERGARYDGALYTPAERFDYRVTIALPDGTVDIAAVREDTPATLPVDVLRAIARTVVKDALSVSPPVWPRRVVRWRDK